MRQYFLIQYDQTGNAELREEKRGMHIAFRKALGNALALAGPLLDDDGTPEGSVIILAAADKAEAERIAASDPFVEAGLLELRSVQMMRIAAMIPPCS